MSSDAHLRPPEAHGSYRRILSATSLLGGATAVNVLIGMVRVKFVAILLGPAGLGLMGAFQSIVTMAASFATMGLNYSGVREIAEARGGGDAARLSLTLATFNRVLWLMAFFGAALLAALSVPVSLLTFDDGEHAVQIALLSGAVFCGVLTAKDSTLIQSAQEIRRLAWVNVSGALIGTGVSLGCFALWRQQGILPAILVGALFQWLVTRMHARRTALWHVDQTAGWSAEVAGRLFKFGGMIVVLGLLVSVTSYLQRVLIIRGLGESALGFFQAADGLSGLYAGYILGAMGTDFLPRLSAVGADHEAVNRLVNEQTVVALLIGIPGVVGTITFAPLLMPLFYAAEFAPAAGLLKWLAVGVFGRLVSWPLSFILMSRGDIRFLWTNVLSSAVQLLAFWAGLSQVGLNMCGYATILSFVVFTWVNLAAVRDLTGFVWTQQSRQVISLGLAALLVTKTGDWLLPALWAWVPGALVFLISCIAGYRQLCHLTQIPLVARLLGSLRRQAS